MADKFCTFTVYSFPGQSSDGKMLPAAYMESDYIPVAVRIHADKAPDFDDASFDIFDDGVSIFNYPGDTHNLPKTMGDSTKYPLFTSENYDTTVKLAKDQNSDDMLENFNNTEIERGSWLTCQIKNDGGGRNFTVILELEKVTEADEADE